LSTQCIAKLNQLLGLIQQHRFLRLNGVGQLIGYCRELAGNMEKRARDIIALAEGLDCLIPEARGMTACPRISLKAQSSEDWLQFLWPMLNRP